MELPLEIKMKPTSVPAVEMAGTSGDQPTEEDPEAAASGGPSRLFPASRTCPHAHPEEPESRRGGGREGQRQGRQPAAGNRACQEPVPGRPVTRSLELCAHSRLGRNVTQMAATVPSRCLGSASRVSAREQSGLAVLPAPKAGIDLIHENI